MHANFKSGEHDLAPEDPSAMEGQIEVSADADTVWVHAVDGSTVGRFSKRFGMDVHRTATDQLAGAPQCLHCTHRPCDASDWEIFVQLMMSHHGIEVPKSIINHQSSNFKHEQHQ